MAIIKPEHVFKEHRKEMNVLNPKGWFKEKSSKAIGQRVDLTINEKIFIEIKYILRSGIRTEKRWKERLKIVQKDIDKLRTLMKKYPISGVVAIFSENYEKEDEPFYEAVKESCEKSGITILRARRM